MPVYWFLTWEDEQSFIIYNCLMFGTLAAYYVMAYLTRMIKKPWTWEQSKPHAS